MTDILPDEPNWLIWVGVVAAILVIILRAFFNLIFDRDRRPKPDWSAWDVWRYLYDWTELRHRALAEIEVAMLQAAMNRDIRAWGSIGQSETVDFFSDELFKGRAIHLLFTRTKKVQGIPVALPMFESALRAPEKRGTPISDEEYQNLWFYSSDVIATWPRQWIRTFFMWIGERVKAITHQDSL